MRQTLFRIWLERPWAGWTPQPEGPPFLGAGWVWLVLVAGFVIWSLIKNRSALTEISSWVPLAGVYLALSLGSFGVGPASLPVFGYGMMVLIGFLSALTFARARARAAKFDPELITDLATWLLLAGVGGGRLAYLLQYGDVVFGRAASPADAFFQAINLAQGGLVLIGALVGGTIGFFAFCYRREINPFAFADIIIPAVFIGIGFGRIGCLMNGCCFGDLCDLPWLAIRFPPESLTFQILVDRGFVAPDAAATIPLHPTQIYSSINGFVLAIVTGTFFWYRRYPGDVFALACILYPVTRILLEFLRSDEKGQLGTMFTISQWYSVGILTLGVLLLVAGPWRSRLWPRNHPVHAH